MRARSIKPGVVDNEILGTADPLYTLLFERLWMIADRKGRLEDRPLRIKAQAFPYRDGLDMDAMLGWLADKGFVTRYAVNGAKYIQILAFAKHQSPHKNEQDSVIPGMDELGTTMVVPPENQGGDKDALTPDSGLLTPDSGLRVTRERQIVPRETLSQDFDSWVQTEYPHCTGRRQWMTALHDAGVIVETGRAAELDLRRRVTGYRAFVEGKGVSGPERVYTPQSFFALGAEDPPWGKEWAAPKTKAEQQQDSNISAVQQFLNRAQAPS